MAAPKPNIGTLDADIAFHPGPEDTVSALRWSPKADHVAASAWDGRVYIYDATNVAGGTGSIRPVTAMNNNLHPFLDCDFNQEGKMIAGASTDGKVHIMDLNAPGQTMTLSGHQAPVRTVRWVDLPCAGNSTGLLVSGSWDKTLRFWDKRQPNPIATVNLTDRVWAMDGSGTTLVAGTADNKIHIFNLGKMTQSSAIRPTMVIDSPLVDQQIRCIAVKHGGQYWAVGGIGGRVAFGATQPNPMKSGVTFSFKCHREVSKESSKVTNVYAVNDLAFANYIAHQNGSTARIVMATAGQDGQVMVWNVTKKTRLISYPSPGGSITACGFNWDATMFAYAVGYDWGMGCAYNTPNYPRGLALRRVDYSWFA
ncbi:uncharacterized protein QC764_708300 [Podospora pseudoanserina]|uniref:Poly(A)+ RNA export protein n=1 Tax=Podospora pseudoanserina TaxID=2609844 RepID=A0ABR0HKD6_9PEZI|nr:hypothetical protein QC764_708300 [Podospora pseudoanserina]